MFEYGSLGEEFFLILKGTVEIQIPDKAQAGKLREVKAEMNHKTELLETALEDAEQFDDYSKKLEEEKFTGDAIDK